MKDTGEKKDSVKNERVFDILCLVASFGILFLLPQKTGLFFYAVFGVSAFLFCIGFFRLGFTFDAPSDSQGELFAGLFYAVFGALLNTTGLYRIIQEHGSERSIMIATLLLIEALVMFSMAGSGFKSPAYQKVLMIVFRAAAVLLIISGTVFAIRKHFADASVIVLTMLVIESICLWKMGRGSNPFNTLNPELQTVPGLRTPIEQLQQTFSGVKTQLGYPWLGKLNTIEQDVIIYGPSEDGFAVCGYYLFGRFYVAGSTDPAFDSPEDAQKHVVAEIPDINGVLLNKEELTEAYIKMFSRYAENGSVRWVSDYPEQTAP